MSETRYISITSNYRRYDLDIRTIQYVFVNQNLAEFHISDGNVYHMRYPIVQLEPQLGDSFIRIHRNYLVSVMAIHEISDKVYLSNGEALNYAIRRKKELTALVKKQRKMLLDRLTDDSFLHSTEEYHTRYQAFDDLPIAFCDIEMVQDDKMNAVDWIFRYGNTALAKLERIPLDKLLGQRFSSLFPNMDDKWLKSYERAAFYGQTLEIVDFSPEIDTYLNIICFPTQPGHCGCIMLNFKEMEYAENQGDRQNARLHYIAKLLEQMI